MVLFSNTADAVNCEDGRSMSVKLEHDEMRNAVSINFIRGLGFILSVFMMEIIWLKSDVNCSAVNPQGRKITCCPKFRINTFVFGYCQDVLPLDA